MMNETRQERRLASIMFTDIVGYSKIMGEDEDKAFQLLRINREIQQSSVEKFGGQWLKEIGDAVLAIFPSDTQSVNCAKEIIDNIKKVPDLQIRIGIHEGEVVFEDNDVFGDGVNIAARLQTVAGPNDIYISENVFRNIENKTGLNAQFIGEEILKNIKYPIKVFRISEASGKWKKSILIKGIPKKIFFIIGFLIVAASLYLVFNSMNASKSQKKKSIAVLPFDNESNEKENEYFVNGMMEDVRNNLSKISDLRVISKTSTEKYRGSNLLMHEIANELNVNYLLEGSVQKQGNEIKVHAQLIQAETDNHIWSETYVRTLDQVFQLQSEIAETIGAELEVAITPQEKLIIEEVPTSNTEAYEMYLRGKEYLFKGGSQNLNVAIYFFKEAIKLDPEFALAYAWQGSAYFFKMYEENYYKEEFGDSLRYFAETALNINPNLADGHWFLAQYYWVRSDIDNSTAESRKAIELNPNHGSAYSRLGMNNYYNEDYEEAFRNLDKAKMLLVGNTNEYPQVLNDIATVNMSICNYDESKSALEEMVYYDPVMGNFYLGFLEICLGRFQSVKEYADKLCLVDDGFWCKILLNYYYIMIGELDQFQIQESDSNKLPIIADNWKGYILYKQGMVEEAQKFINRNIENWEKEIELKRVSGTGGQAQYELAAYYAFTGEEEKAYQNLHEMSENKFDGVFVWIMQIDPRFEDLRKEKEFQTIVSNRENKLKEIRTNLKN